MKTAVETKIKTIDCREIAYRQLNEMIHEAVGQGVRRFVLDNVLGQRFIGDNLGGGVEIVINGTPGNDLAAFMDGPRIIVHGNAQDGVGNTMNNGLVVVHGNAGDITGHSMRGGRIYVRGDVGYRVGIHMKAYKELFPVLIAGGRARDFLGEYMAGGLLVILGLDSPLQRQSAYNSEREIVGDFVGTGMHNGTILLRGKVDERMLGKEVKMIDPSKEDMETLKKYLSEYCGLFNLNMADILKKPFYKLYPYSNRPYGKLYAY